MATPASSFIINVAKWDKFANLVWNKSWNIGFYNRPWDILYLERPTSIGDEVWIVGEFYPSGNADIFWAKYGINGTFMGNWSWGGPGDDVGVCLDTNGAIDSFTLWGYTNSWKAKIHILQMTILANGAVHLNQTKGDNLYDYTLCDATSVFFAGRNGTDNILVGRWDGTPWMKSITFGTGIYGTWIVADYPSYVYVYASTSDAKPKLVCYNGTGVFQWSRSFETTWLYTKAIGIKMVGSTIWTLTSDEKNMAITAWSTSGTSLRNITRLDTAYHESFCWAWRNNDIYVGSALRTNGQELAIYAEDIDGDGLGKVTEDLLGTSDTNLDSDDDTMPDAFEVANHLDPADPTDKKGDADGDGLANFLEYVIGTNVLEKDTDSDGWSDRDELLANTSPLDPLDHPTSTGPAIDMNTIYIAVGCIAAGFVIGIIMGIAAKKKKQAGKERE
ncbi:MAG: thrombospondin type 3 repeat-containing protein [Candidatus Sigynarchaeota archaeon]